MVIFSYYTPDNKQHQDEKNFVAYTDSEGKFTWDAPAEFFAAGNKIEVGVGMADKNNKFFETTDQLNSAVGYVVFQDAVAPTDPVLSDMEVDFKDLGPRLLFCPVCAFPPYHQFQSLPSAI